VHELWKHAQCLSSIRLPLAKENKTKLKFFAFTIPCRLGTGPGLQPPCMAAFGSHAGGPPAPLATPLPRGGAFLGGGFAAFFMQPPR
jgi:hypothetical protein